MSSIISNDYCNNLKTIPQFSGTCWFNVILTVMLYSEGFRKELNKILKGRRKSKEDKLLNFILYMLRNYNNIEKLKKIYDDFNNILIKPEYLLISYLKIYDIEFLREILIDLNFGKNKDYIYKLLKSYNIPYLSLIYHKDNIYYENIELNFHNIILIEYNIDHLDVPYNFKFNAKNIDNYNDFLLDVKNKNKTINLNGHIYKLDCSLIGNYNKASVGGHAIAGITCNNKKYIIDSIIKNSINIPYKNSKKYKEKIYTCNPILYNWDTTSKICISSDCIINPPDENELCFDLDTSSIILIYIKTETSIESSDIHFDETSLISKDYKYNKEEFSLYIKELLSNIENKTNYELISILKKIMLSDIYINYLKENIINYKLLYEKLVKKPLDITKNKDLLLKDILIQLLYKYYKKGIIYNILDYRDYNTIYKIIINLSINNEINLNIIKNEYNELYIKSGIIDFNLIYNLNIDIIYNILYKQYETFYDKNIIELNSDKNKQIILKLLILKEFFKKKYNIVFKEIINIIKDSNNYETINIIIKKLSIYNQENLNIIKNQYNEIFIKSDINNFNDYKLSIYNYNIDNIYNILYIKYPTLFDKNIIELNTDKNKQIILKLLILKEFIKEKYNLVFKEIVDLINTYISNIINSVSFNISVESENDIIYDNIKLKTIIEKNTQKIYNYLFKYNKYFFDNEIKKIYKQDYDKQISIEYYIFNKLLILKDFFNKEYNKIIEYIINDEYINDIISSYSLLINKELFHKYDSDYIENIIKLNTDEIYKFLYITNNETYDRFIKNNKNNKYDKKRQIIIKLLILRDLFNINYNKKLQEINYKRETGKEMRSRTSSSRTSSSRKKSL